jgi:hypothetical protein
MMMSLRQRWSDHGNGTRHDATSSVAMRLVLAMVWSMLLWSTAALQSFDGVKTTSFPAASRPRLLVSRNSNDLCYSRTRWRKVTTTSNTAASEVSVTTKRSTTTRIYSSAENNANDRALAMATAAEEASHYSSRVFDDRWNTMFEKLKAYKEVHGNCTVINLYVCDDGTKLGRWVKSQRRLNPLLKDAALRERRREALDSIGFVWVVNERNRQLSLVTGGVHASEEDRYNARWNFMFEKLKEYKVEHGDCLVPHKYNCTDGSRLGHWVAKQRRLSTTDSVMKPLRRRALDSIGFAWKLREPYRSLKWDEHWNERFRLLQEYHTEHGDCLVPLDYAFANSTIKLGTWVSFQRERHAAGKLRKDRVIQLESLDFSFRALPDDSVQALWDRLFERLVQYKQEHGHCRVPITYKRDRQLGVWVKGLRNRRYTLSADQRAALDALGFIWRVDR